LTSSALIRVIALRMTISVILESILKNNCQYSKWAQRWF
jgi:hypothetical protein